MGYNRCLHGLSPVPVSYTHLDVYKRQPYGIPTSPISENLQSLKSVQNFACDVLPIYDHIPLYCSV